MKLLQVSDASLRRALAEWTETQKNPDFTVTDAAAPVRLYAEGTDFILSAEGHEVDRYSPPMRMAELLADITWLMARRAEESVREIKLSGNYVLLPHEFTLRCGDLAVTLTGREVALLQFLASNGESSKEVLLSEVWRYHPDSDTHTVETHLWRLRQKLQTAGMDAPLIVTTEKGYRLA